MNAPVLRRDLPEGFKYVIRLSVKPWRLAPNQPHLGPPGIGFGRILVEWLAVHGQKPDHDQDDDDKDKRVEYGLHGQQFP